MLYLPQPTDSRDALSILMDLQVLPIQIPHHLKAEMRGDVGTLEAEDFRLSVLKGAESQASTIFDSRPWKRLLKLSDSTGVVGVV